MSKRYLILIDSRDSEKLRRFRNGKFNTTTQKILNKYNLKFIWGFHKAQISDSWKNIRRNDHVFFSIPKNNFEITAQVAKKITGVNMDKVLWSDDVDAQNITHYLLFDNIQKTNLLFTQTLVGTIKKIKMPFPGIYELKKSFRIDRDNSKHPPASINISKPKSFAEPMHRKGPAGKETFEIVRFLRDSNKVKRLKKLYDNKCQVCGYTFEYKKGKYYSEVHHYNPLKANADDDLDNMIVVCPNHHAKFDYNLIAISHDGKTIIDGNGKPIGTIHFKNDHRLNMKNIESQLEEI